MTVIQEAITYLDDFPLEVIREALVRTARKQGRWDYAKRILDNWLEEKIDTLEKITVKDMEFRNRSNVPKNETEEEKKARKIKELEEAIRNDTQ